MHDAADDIEAAPLAPLRFRRVRIVLLRVVSIVCGLMAMLSALVLVSPLITRLWPNGPVTANADLTAAVMVYMLLFGVGSAITARQLWRRERAGALVALVLFGGVAVANYVGPYKGTQSIGLATAMLALLALGWAALEPRRA